MQRKAHKITWKQRLSKALVAIIALLVLNCSVDTAYDPVAMKWDGKEYSEDATFNDIESIYELVTECWMDMDDFVPEQEEEDGYELGKTFKDWVAQPMVEYSLLKNTFTQNYPPHNTSIYLSISEEVNIPPPDHLG